MMKFFLISILKPLLAELEVISSSCLLLELHWKFGNTLSSIISFPPPQKTFQFFWVIFMAGPQGLHFDFSTWICCRVKSTPRYQTHSGGVYWEWGNPKLKRSSELKLEQNEWHEGDASSKQKLSAPWGIKRCFPGFSQLVRIPGKGWDGGRSAFVSFVPSGVFGC